MHIHVLAEREVGGGDAEEKGEERRNRAGEEEQKEKDEMEGREKEQKWEMGEKGGG